MKTSQRLDNNRLSEVLAERALVEPQALREAANFAVHGKIPMSEALVTANLVQDWQLAGIVSEIYNLPFLPVEMLDPDPRAREGIDEQFLLENCLVPVGRYGQVLTVCMPAMVPADVLGLLAATTDLVILPLVGSVRSNRQWLEKNLSSQALAPANPLGADPLGAEEESAPGGGRGAPGEWGSLFDQADAAVLLDLAVPAPENSDDDGGAFGEMLGQTLGDGLLSDGMLDDPLSEALPKPLKPISPEPKKRSSKE
ncbi:MAG: hypothetical protein IPJ19_06390 [Planctomycetes bacterium]|nr:hypothetical protein [Planctomycetota bacterium]